MARKIISEPEPEPEPEGAEEIETQETEETQEEEIKPATKPKRVLTEKQLESLKKAREAAAKALPKKEIEVKAAEYDKLEEKKKQLTQPPEPKPIKRSTKKVVEVEEEEDEEEVIVVKKQPKKVIINNNNSLDQEVSMLSIQQKLKAERQRVLMNTLSPMC